MSNSEKKLENYVNAHEHVSTKTVTTISSELPSNRRYIALSSHAKEGYPRKVELHSNYYSLNGTLKIVH